MSDAAFVPGADPVVLVVDDADDDQRLDQCLARRVPELSRARLQGLIRAGHVDVDGATVTEPKRKVKAGAAIAVALPAPEPSNAVAEAIPLEIVYEDPHLLVVNKPAGLVVHPAAGHASGTLVNALLAHCGSELSGIGGVARPGIVHRLDKETSGLLVVAKSDAAHQGLAAQFADHGRTGPLERTYRALAWGAPKPVEGRIDAPIGRAPNHRQRFAIVASGKPAVTHYSTDRRFPASDPIASLVSCRLETGRTHQIRVHLSAKGHPLLGDTLYGAGFRTKANRLPAAVRERIDALSGQALHAAVLGFAHPVTGETLRFESPLPPDLDALLAALDTLPADAPGRSRF
ncbi:RluA family pseudouridine synthase [Amorphus sp. 3PC139-8]|uniref:RluA family pseudouridine synthase n=1 Tax=Amorphus sp. 3PC139-8 TaxID=2735676 RepID=UPI00345DDB76